MAVPRMSAQKPRASSLPRRLETSGAHSRLEVTATGCAPGSGPLIVYSPATCTFHLRAGASQYAFRTDASGCLEHLYFGPWLGADQDLGYPSESSPFLDYEVSSVALRVWRARLLQRLKEVGAQEPWQVWSALRSFARTGQQELGDRFHTQRAENICWRMREFWQAGDTDMAPCLISEALERSELLRACPLPSNAEHQGLKSGAKTSRLLEVSEFGTGDYRSPSLEAVFKRDGSQNLSLQYLRHSISKGIIPSNSGLPLLGHAHAEGAESLLVVLADASAGLQVSLVYTVFPGISAVARRMLIENVGPALGSRAKFRRLSGASTAKAGSRREGVDLLKAMSATFDLDTEDWHLVSLQGCYGAERLINVQRLQEGMVELGSRRGVSSHQANPVCVLTAGPPSEEHGVAYGVALLYSGNWRMEVERSYTGATRLNVGLHPATFRWSLSPDAVFETPECVCVFSDGCGLSGVTANFHRIFKERMIAPQWHKLVCPVLVNTWEAMYFKVQHEKVVELARRGKDVGAEMLVLDDGWFGARDNDTSSLGDWSVNLSKFPRGLKGLADDVNALGMKLGIWMEPEMTNRKSDLFARHPEWVLRHPHRCMGESRNQLSLDMSRQEVQEFVIDAVCRVLRSANIEYVKWDMNRPLSDIYSSSLPPEQQGEVYHRYILGLYRVFERITSQFPQVLFESCAAGGGRFDPALLAWCPQVWTSDNTDAFCRTRIQFGTSLWAPVSSMGAHITECPNHITGRTTPLKARFIVALFGTFGLELNLGKLSEQERQQMRAMVALRQRLCSVVLHGTFYRLPRLLYPGGDSTIAGLCASAGGFAWMFVSGDRRRAVVSALVFHQDTLGRYPSKLKLRGLIPDAIYKVEELLPTVKSNGETMRKCRHGLQLSGGVLMNLGLPAHFSCDGDSLLLEIFVDGRNE